MLCRNQIITNNMRAHVLTIAIFQNWAYLHTHIDWFFFVQVANVNLIIQKKNEKDFHILIFFMNIQFNYSSNFLN